MVTFFTGYADDGDPIHTCVHCGAIFWYAERLNRRIHTNNPVYTGCCMQGQVVLPLLKDSPELLNYLVTSDDEVAKHFRDNIRPYNMIFSFTSIGGRVDRSVKKGRGPSMFALQGENYHLMGSLKPKPGDYAKFQQLYIVDTANEIENRMNILRYTFPIRFTCIMFKYPFLFSFCNHNYYIVKFHSKGKEAGTDVGKKKFRQDIVEALLKLLNDVNPHVQAFRFARDRFETEKEDSNFHMRIVSKRQNDGRMYNMPTASEVAALIPGGFDEHMDKRDIVLQSQNGKLKRIHECHVAYLALQYPLLFPRGEDGYRLGIKKTATRTSKSKKQKDISMRQWFAYRLQERKKEKHTLLRSKRLLQQFIVDGYTMIESNRLRFLKKNQKQLRGTNMAAVQEASNAGDDDLTNKGKSIIIPPSFTGGPRYMRDSYLDAMATCKHFGFPDLFITFTCNSKWPEITRFVNERNLKAEDRPDIICRVFKMKLDNLMDDLTRKHIFGKTITGTYIISQYFHLFSTHKLYLTIISH